MSWIIIVIAVIVVFLLVYVFYPSIKKSFSKTSKASKPDFKSKRRSRKAERVQEKNRQSELRQENKNSKVEIIENKGDFFAENIFNDKEDDPDTRVNYDNFDFDGLFESEASESSSSLDEELHDSHNVYSDKFEELFENDFSVFDDFKPNYNNDLSELLEKSRRGGFSLQTDDEISDLLTEDRVIFSEENEVKKQLDRLSPEMKILFLSNFLDRKDD